MASHLEGPQPLDVMLRHWPGLCTVQRDRHYHIPKNLHFVGLAKVTTPEDIPPPHLVHFASLLEPHCNFFLYLGTLTHLNAQVRERLHFLQYLARSVMDGLSLTCQSLPCSSTVRILVLLILICMLHRDIRHVL